MNRRIFFWKVIAASFLGKLLGMTVEEEEFPLYYIHRGNVEYYEPVFPGKVQYLPEHGEYHISYVKYYDWPTPENFQNPMGEKK